MHGNDGWQVTTSDGANIVVDGGGWVFAPRFISKDTVRNISRQVERRSREENFVQKAKL